MYRIRWILVLACVLAIFVYWFLGLGDFIFNPIFSSSSDTNSYIDAANMLFKEYKPHYIRPPLYPFLIGLIQIIFEKPTIEKYIFFSIIINMASWILSLTLLFKTLQFYLKDKISFWLTIYMLFSFGIVVHIYFLLTESVTLLFLSAIAYYLLKFSKDQHYGCLIIASSLLNLLILVRPGFLYMGFIFSIALVTHLIYKKLRFNKEFAFFLFSIGLVLVQYYAMYKSYGKPTVSFIDKITWYRYLGAQASADALNLDFEKVLQTRDSVLLGKSYLEIDEICARDFMAQIGSNLLNIVPNYVKNLATNSVGGSTGIFIALNVQKSKSKTYTLALRGFFYLTMFQNACYVLLLFISVFLIVRKIAEVDFGILILCLLALYVFLTSAISFWQGDRFHLVLYPMILILFSYGIRSRIAHTS